MEQKIYIPEKYWDHVAEQIQLRNRNDLLAGDSDPFYVYKRKKFLSLLASISFTGKRVIEVGAGPGGNLMEIYLQHPAYLTGADISSQMLNICRQNIGNRNIELVKTNGEDLPFERGCFDIAITSTVLQHITDEAILSELIKNICRVTRSDVYIFEQIEKKHKESSTNAGRTIEEYRYLFEKYNMSINTICFLNVWWSKLVCGMIRKVFNTFKRNEGSSQTKVSVFLQKIALNFTKPLDNWLLVKDFAMLHFKRDKK
jgi:ubiquinone/menaquinone biosynthesis C-methylase UbiE